MSDDIREAIIRAARESGIDPSYALAVADRESSFNPRARASKTIRGLFQMRGDLRQQHGVGDSDDPYTQAKGWTSFIQGVKGDMGKRLGRAPTDQEAYLGHHFGAGRAASMLQMDPSTPVDSVFTPNEMRLNPHFGRAGTVGKLNSSVMADIGERQQKFGAPAQPDQSQPYKEAGEALDLSEFGDPVGGSGSMASAAPDFSMYGDPVA